MSDMIERVARRLFLSRYPDSEEYWPNRLFEVTVETADSYRTYASDVFEEILEPTDAMVEAGDIFADGPGYSAKVWRDMIEVARNEKVS